MMFSQGNEPQGQQFNLTNMERKNLKRLVSESCAIYTLRLHLQLIFTNKA